MKSIKNMTQKEISHLLLIDRDKAKQIKDLLTGKLKTKSFTSVQKWVSQCHNEPTLHEKRMEALNEIIKGYGNEAIFSSDYNNNWPLITYVNIGDPYTLTILYLADIEKYIISAWGDMIEYYENKGYHFN